MNDEFWNQLNHSENDHSEKDRNQEASKIEKEQGSEPNFILYNTPQDEEDVNMTVQNNVEQNFTEQKASKQQTSEVNFTMKNEEPVVDFIHAELNKENESIKRKEKKPAGKGKRFVKKTITLVSAAAVFGVIAGAAFQGVEYLQEHKQQDKSVVGMESLGEYEDYNNDANNNTADDGSVVQTGATTAIVATDVSGVVENVMPSIVAINSTTTMTEYDFFGRQYESEVSGSGSGIIIGQNDDELLIVTNNHVVEDATAVEIEFVDESKALATIKGTEPSSDLAVLSVKLSDLAEGAKKSIRIATLGDSDQVKTGEMAIAIGNALGYGQSVTVGYISALDREVKTENVTLTLLQTDAAINPGNSGGALINARGEIIGINSVKYASTDVEGIGYAIPISDAIPIINDLMNREDLKEDEMAYLGITGKNVEANYAQAFGMPVGIIVYEVGEDTAAQKAGIVKGDIIVGINGKKLETMQDLSNTLSYTRGGTTVTMNLKVLQNGEYVNKDVEVTLGFRGR